MRPCEAEKPNRRKRFKPFYGARKLGLAHVRFGETSKCALPNFVKPTPPTRRTRFALGKLPVWIATCFASVSPNSLPGGALPPWTPDHLTTSFSILNLVHLFQDLFREVLKMHGGKREGAGRKSSGRKKSSCMAQQRKKLCCEKPLKSFAKNQN